MVERINTADDPVFGAIAHPMRRAILRELRHGPRRVTDIAQKFPVSLNAVSKHLRVLERARLIRRDVRGRDHLCRLNARPLGRATSWIEEIRGFWEPRLDAFERHVVRRRSGR